MSTIRLVGITDFNILSAFRDVEQRLLELERKLTPQASARDPEVAQLQEDVAKLKSETARDPENAFIPQGPMSLPGLVPDPGGTSPLLDRVLHANGEWATPFHGAMSLVPPSSAGASIAQNTVNLKGSLTMTGALHADIVYCRRVVAVSQHGEVYVFDNASPQTLTNQNEYYQWTTNWVTSEINGLAWNSSSQFVIKVAGLYRLSFSATLFCGTANQDHEVAFFIDGATANDHRGHVSLLATSDKKQIVLLGLAVLAAGALVDVRVQNVTSAGRALTIEDANFSINRLVS